MKSKNSTSAWLTPPAQPKTRELSLHVPFDLPSEYQDSLANYFEFNEVFNLLQQRSQEVRAIELQSTIKSSKQRYRRLLEILRTSCADKLSLEQTRREVDALGFTDEDKEKFVAALDMAIDPAKKAEQKASWEKMRAEIKEGEKDIARRERLLGIRSRSIETHQKLSEEAIAGDKDAAETLAEIAINAAVILSIIGHRHPEMLASLAAKSVHWPCVATPDPNWDIPAKKFLRDVKFAERTYLADLNPVVAHDRDSPVRTWAKNAYMILQLNRERLPLIGLVRKAAPVLIPETKFHFCDVPEWVMLAGKLAPFSKKTARAWSDVAKKMIRVEYPDFHERPEWADFKNHVSNQNRHGVVSKGRLQNDILEKISTTLVTLARKDVPDSGNPAKET